MVEKGIKGFNGFSGEALYFLDSCFKPFKEMRPIQKWLSELAGRA